MEFRHDCHAVDFPGFGKTLVQARETNDLMTILNGKNRYIRCISSVFLQALFFAK